MQFSFSNDLGTLFTIILAIAFIINLVLAFIIIFFRKKQTYSQFNMGVVICTFCITINWFYPLSIFWENGFCA